MKVRGIRLKVSGISMMLRAWELQEVEVFLIVNEDGIGECEELGAKEEIREKGNEKRRAATQVPKVKHCLIIQQLANIKRKLLSEIKEKLL